jgi:hypothetical protein
MSLGLCIPDLIAAGKIPPEHAERLQSLYDELLANHSPRMGLDAAKALATQQAVEAWEKGIKSARVNRLRQMNRQQAILDQARTGYRGANPDGPINGKALAATLAWDRKAGYANVEYTEREIKQTALGMMYDVLAKHRANVIGQLRNKSDLTDMVRELHGGDTGNVNARELADSWRKTAEYLRQRFNAAGGAIGKLEDWGLPQSHDPLRVGAVSPEAWIDTVMPMLDRSRMIDRNILQPMNDAALRDMLRQSYDRIVSDGWVGRQPGQGGSAMLANRHGEQRVLHFDGADNWIAYNDRFGQATPWEAMMGHVHRLSRDTAMMEVLGPNPNATIRWMKDVAIKDAAERGTLADRKAANKAAHDIDRLWSVLTGAANRPVSETGAQLGASFRNFEAATKLGSAVIGSMSDVATSMLTRHFNGMSAISQLPDMLAALNPLDDAVRAQARRAGFISDEFIGHAVGAGRTQLEDLSGGRMAGSASMRERWAAKANETTRRLADGVLRASGLNAWTMAGREAIGKEFAATFAEQSGKTFGQLDPALQGFFNRYGLGERGWDAVRATAHSHDGGYAAIWPNAIADEAVGRRLLQAMLTETDFAVPTGGLRQKALLAGYRPGTIMGEAARTGFQFKMFPVTVMAMHTMRMMDQPGAWSKARYAALFLGATTLMGALAYQMSNIVKGQDPSHMDTMDFWWRAMLKGGGLGVFGDTVNNSTNKYGQNVGNLMVGPALGSAQEVANFAWGKDVIGPDGQKQRVHDVARLLERETPGLSSLWYTRAAYQHILLDTLGEMQGTRTAQSYQRLQNRAARDGTQFFWRPGQRRPDRLPDLTAAFSASPETRPVDQGATPE